MSDNFYYHKEKAGVDLYLDRAMNAEATATRQRELLKRCHAELLRVRDFVDYEPYELLDELAKELADEDSTGGISHAVGSQD